MRTVHPDIFRWSWFCEEKGYDFNGFYIVTQEGAFIIDPVLPTSAVWTTIEKIQKPKAIYLTNKHHTRKAAEFKERYGCPICIHEADSPLMEIPVDQTFRDGETLLGGFKVIQIPNNKTPGESALFLNWGSGIMILGDALIGHPAGQLTLLPVPKIKDPVAAKEGLKKLLNYSFDLLLVGDGNFFLKEGKSALERFLKKPNNY